MALDHQGRSPHGADPVHIEVGSHKERDGAGVHRMVQARRAGVITRQPRSAPPSNAVG